MVFTSLFFPIFLVIAVSLYFLLPGKYRAAFLLIISWFSCALLSIQAFVVLILVTVFTYFAARWIDRADPVSGSFTRKRRTFLSVVICISTLALYKYTDNLTIPVGLSFYLFQAIGYLADISRQKYKAETNFIKFSLFLSYFAKFISGPIERGDSFMNSLNDLGSVRFLHRGRLSLAITYLLYGYCMKLVIADRLALIVNPLFEAPGSYDSFILLAGVLLYTVQIYCDFAGYSLIAIGCSLLFGIRLTANFNAPYFSVDITDFWRRWHISLSSWLRDYVYIPLGGNRQGLVRKCINTMIVFVLCGIWHGNGFNFLAWGILHGLYSILNTLLKMAKIKIPFSRFFTFVEVSFAWVFFKASGFTSAVSYLYHMVTGGIRLSEYPAMLHMLSLNSTELMIIIVLLVILFLSDRCSYYHKEAVPELIQHLGNAKRYFVFYSLLLLIFIFGIYGPGYHSDQFIYMQF